MRVRRCAAALLAVALIAGAPAAAHAQGSAGDDQYQDPFGGATNGTSRQPHTDKGADAPSRESSSSPSSSGSAGSTGAGDTSAPAAGSSSAGAGSSSVGAASSSASASAPAPSSGRQLPRTGLDAAVVALLGFALVAAGLGLRRRLRAVDGRR